MATLQIEFRDKKFVSHNGVNVVSATTKEIVGNGWNGKVDEEGNITCVSVQYLAGVRYQLKFKIVDGFVKKILKVGDNRPIVLKSYILKNWPIDGVIGLGSGKIDNRTTYFRTQEFQDFLDKYGITAVRFESPNNIHSVVKINQEGFYTLHESIKTDGDAEVIDQNMQRDSASENITFQQKVKVTNATWVVKSVLKGGKLANKILFTTANPRELRNLPKE